MINRSNIIRLPLFAAAAILFTTVGHAASWSNGNTPCERSAHDMRKACKYDVADNYNEAVARCRNLNDADERSECFADAFSEALEEKELCADKFDARNGACSALGEYRYDPDPLTVSTTTFIDPDDIPGTYAINPYVSLKAGHTYVLRAGEEGEETVIVHVTDESREILGALCRVVKDIVVEVGEEAGAVEYEGVEVTDDWFAQDTVGNVYYCGEIARNYEDGILRDLDGSFEAGRDSAKSGELARAFPVAGDTHRQEFALGEAEDIILYVDTATAPTEEEGGDNPNFPCSPDMCLQTFDYSPLEPASTEYKYYLPGTGFVLAVAMEDGEVTGEREELVCVGDSLEILSNPVCEIDEPEELLATLCELAPETFCED